MKTSQSYPHSTLIYKPLNWCDIIFVWCCINTSSESFSTQLISSAICNNVPFSPYLCDSIFQSFLLEYRPCGWITKRIICIWYNKESFLCGDGLVKGLIFLICFLRYKVLLILLEIENIANSSTALLENLQQYFPTISLGQIFEFVSILITVYTMNKTYFYTMANPNWK